MKKIAFFDTKPYDKLWFDKCNKNYEITYIDSKLNQDTAVLASNHDVVCAFVNDVIDAKTVDILFLQKIKLIAMRCAGYNNIDIKSAYKKINIVRVPNYSPQAIAEHAMALLLSISRKIHKAYARTREFNFSLNGLIGMDLYKKTIGIVGTGKIGKTFANICKGFDMNIIAYDLYPDKTCGLEYVELDYLFENSDIISLHCPLTNATKNLINKKAFDKMKQGVLLVNTSRGALIKTEDLLDNLNNGKVRAAALDVYDEESDIFFEDKSETLIKDDVLSLLISKPNVLLTSHQAFLTENALENIARVTFQNIDDFFDNKPMSNEICYLCDKDKNYK